MSHDLFFRLQLFFGQCSLYFIGHGLIFSLYKLRCIYFLFKKKSKIYNLKGKGDEETKVCVCVSGCGLKLKEGSISSCVPGRGMG